MARIISVTEYSIASGSSSGAIAFPTHVSGDLLLCCLTQDGGGTSITPNAASATAGWAMIGTGATSGACYQQWAYKVATSTTGEDPTFSGATNEWIAAAIVVRFAHGTPFGSLASGTDFIKADWNAVGSIDSGALTTGADNCLLLYSWGMDQDNALDAMRVSPNDMAIDSLYSYTAGAQVAHLIGHRQMGAAGAAPTVKMYNNNAAAGGNGWVIAIRDDGTGNLQPDCRTGASVVKWYGDFGVAFETLTYSALSNITTDTIDTLGISTEAPGGGKLAITHVTGDLPNLPGYYTNIATTESSAGIWVGVSHAVTANMSGKVLSLQWQVSSVNTAQLGSKGWIVILSDGTKWAAYQLSPLLSGTAVDTAFINQIALGDATPLATHASGEPDWTAITKIGYAWHRAGSSATSRSMNIRNVMLLDQASIIGGGASAPATLAYLPDIATAGRVRNLANKQGKGQVLAKGKVQIGDGSTPTYFSLSAQSFEYPLTWVASDGNKNVWNAGESSVGLTIYASSADTIDFSAGVVATEVRQPFTIHASSHTGADYSFSGTSFVGWDVTWKAGIVCTGVTFSGCGPIATKGANLTSCTVTDTLATSSEGAVTVDTSGSTIDGCTVDVTGTSAGYHLELGTAVTAITLTDVTFTGTPGTDKVHVLKTTGTVTITISGTTSLVAGDVTSAGAMVDIAAPEIYQVVNITNLVTGSRVQIYDTTNTVELANELASGSTVTWTDGTPYAADRDIRVRIAYVSGVTAKQFIEAAIGTVGDGSPNSEVLTYRANQSADTVYDANGLNGSTIYGAGEITFTDSSPDVINMDMAADTISLPTQYAAWVYYAFTSTGIATDIDYINAIDTANYEYSGIKWKNTSSPTSPLKVTGGYAWDSATLDPMDLIDDTGGTLFLAPAHVVPYATGSGVTPSDVTDIAAASATASAAAIVSAAVDGTTTLAESLRLANAVLGGKVSGAGSTAETFRNLADTKDRMVFTVDSSGNRTAVTRDLT